MHVADEMSEKFEAQVELHQYYTDPKTKLGTRAPSPIPPVPTPMPLTSGVHDSDHAYVPKTDMSNHVIN